MTAYGLTRPLEYNITGTSGHSFRVGVTDVDLGEGVYSDITRLLNAMLVAIKATAGMGNCEMEITSDGLVKLGDLDLDNDPNIFTMTFTGHDTAFRDIIGFEADLAGAKVYTATLTPLYFWKPTYTRANRTRWQLNHDDQWKGQQARGGLVTGILTGQDVYECELLTENEWSYNLFKSAARGAAEQARALDTFIAGSRSSYPTTGNVSTAGLFYYPDYTDIQPNAVTMTAGDASTFEYTTGASTYAFCHFDEKWKGIYKDARAFDVGTSYYDVRIPLHTTSIPEGGWDV